jgi:hypothetical protein
MVVEVLLAVCHTLVVGKHVAPGLVLVGGPSGVGTSDAGNGSETLDGVGDQGFK